MGDEHNARFGELRSLLHGATEGPGAWARVCRLCERWPDPGAFAREVAPYVDGHVAGWSASTRLAPVAWLSRALEGDVEPALALARRVELNALFDPRDHMRTLDGERLLGGDGLLGLARLGRVGGPLERLEELSLSGQEVPAAALAQVCEDDEAFTHLTTLALCDYPALVGAAMGPLCRFVARRPIDALDLSADGLQGAVFQMQAAGVLDRLKGLSLVGFHPDGVGEIEALWGARALERLSVREGMVDALTAVSGAPPRLQALDVGNVLGDLSLRDLAGLPWFARLRELGLSGWNLSEEGWAGVVETFGHRWEALELDAAFIEPFDLLALASGAPALRALDARSTFDAEEEDWVRALGEGMFPALEELSLGVFNASGGAEALIDAPGFGKLRRVYMGEVEVEAPERGWDELAGARVVELGLARGLGMASVLGGVASLGRVRRLDLAECDLTDDVLDPFVVRACARQLEQLDLRMNLLSEGAVARARDALPECDVIWYPHGPQG